MNMLTSMKSLFLSLFLCTTVCAEPLADFQLAMGELNQWADNFEQYLNQQSNPPFVFDNLMHNLITSLCQTKSCWDMMSFDDKNTDAADKLINQISSRLFLLINDAFWLERVPDECREAFDSYIVQFRTLMCSFFSQDIQIKLCALDSLFEQRNFDAALVLVNDIIGSAQPMCNYPFAEITLLEYWLGICKQDFIRCQLEDKIMQLLVELESYFDATNFEGNTEIVTICSDLETCLDDYKSKKGSPQRWADFDARMRAAKDFLKTKGFIFWADYV